MLIQNQPVIMLIWEWWVIFDFFFKCYTTKSCIMHNFIHNFEIWSTVYKYKHISPDDQPLDNSKSEFKNSMLRQKRKLKTQKDSVRLIINKMKPYVFYTVKIPVCSCIIILEAFKCLYASCCKYYCQHFYCFTFADIQMLC